MERAGNGMPFWESIFNTLVDNIFLVQVNDFFFLIPSKEIVDRYEGKIWEDFFTKHFEQVMACVSKLFQSYYVAQ